jgi:murein DD-endopeptidase MepM/ murein hydrolase activator NlpD
VRPAGARRAIGLAMLLPWLLPTHPGAAEAETRAITSSARRPAPSAETPVGRTVHVVRAGDSLSRIALRYSVTRKSLIDANRLEHPDRLRIGQRLVVPGIHRTAAGRPVQFIDGVLENGGLLLVRAGPRRVPTRFYMASPGVDGQPFDFAWPVEGQVISPFGKRRGGWHAGMDIKAELGTPILAAAPGVVTSSGQERAYGRIVRIEHDSGFITVYAHNLENLVEVGDRVSAGTIIATVGRTGKASTPHLHFEVRHDGIVYNPLHLLPPRDLIEVRADEAPDTPTESARAHGADDDVDE